MDIPSATIVLGPFGDLVNYGDDLFLSWYPIGCTTFSTGTRAPSWPPALDEKDLSKLREGIYAGLRPLVPCLSALAPEHLRAAEVNGGIIFALGDTDLSAPTSGLHQRYRTGPRSFGRYHSIDTGKYTTAPPFAKQLADRLLL
jgi:hypothetical protein